MNKYEKLIEYIINEDESKARELFHEIVVEKSRDIYESLIDAEQGVDETVGGNEVEDLVDEITADEEGISEDDIEGEDDAEMDLGADAEMDLGADAEMDLGADAEEAEGEEIEDRVMDLEDALDELKAEFDKLMGEMGSEEINAEESADPMIEAKEEDESDEKEEEGQAELDKLREYVEKIAAPSNKEGADNTKSTVAGKNDMGGTASNIAKGGEEKGGTVKAKGEFTGEFQNKPGAKADLAKAPAAKTGEEGAVNKSSVEAGGK